MYIKYRACVNINSVDVIILEISEDLGETFQCNKSNKINVGNNLFYNSMQDANDLFDKFAKTYYSAVYIFRNVWSILFHYQIFSNFKTHRLHNISILILCGWDSFSKKRDLI